MRQGRRAVDSHQREGVNPTADLDRAAAACDRVLNQHRGAGQRQKKTSTVGEKIREFVPWDLIGGV